MGESMLLLTKTIWWSCFQIMGFEAIMFRLFLQSTFMLHFSSYVAFVFQISSLSLLFQFSFSSYMFRINGKKRPIKPFLFSV